MTGERNSPAGGWGESRGDFSAVNGVELGLLVDVMGIATATLPKDDRHPQCYWPRSFGIKGQYAWCCIALRYVSPAERSLITGRKHNRDRRKPLVQND